MSAQSSCRRELCQNSVAFRPCPVCTAGIIEPFGLLELVLHLGEATPVFRLGGGIEQWAHGGYTASDAVRSQRRRICGAPWRYGGRVDGRQQFCGVEFPPWAAEKVREVLQPFGVSETTDLLVVDDRPVFALAAE